MTLHLSHIARYAPSIQSHIHFKPFAQNLTIVFKQPLNAGTGACRIQKKCRNGDKFVCLSVCFNFATMNYNILIVKTIKKKHARKRALIFFLTVNYSPGTIASLGQTSAQEPHSMQVSGSMW